MPVTTDIFKRDYEKKVWKDFSGKPFVLLTKFNLKL